MKQGLGRTLRTEGNAFRIHELVAAGGFGSVFFGRDLGNSTPVAVKLLHPHHASDPRIVERFEREASLVRGLRHPNVVQVVDQGRDEDGVPFIVMEWVTGWTIADLIQRQRAIPFGEVAMVGRHVLEALEAARRRGVIHRDIKPQNLMVTPDGRVKVMDFGIAKESALAAASGSTGLVGTPAYMAPEQFRGESLDCRTDLYALGITLYQTLAGRVPFEAPSTAGYMYQHLQMSPKQLIEVRPEVPPGLAAVVHRAMAKVPDERYQTPVEMHAALRPFAGDVMQVPPTPPPRIETEIEEISRAPASDGRASAAQDGPGSIVPTAPDQESRPPEPPAPPPARPRTALWALVVAAVLAVIAGGVAVASGAVRPFTTIPTPVVANPAVTTVPVAQAITPTALAGGCQEGLREASELSQRKLWADAATKLESARGRGCDVVDPLYDAHLNQGIALAESERTAEAIGLFDKALQVKDGSDARRERELAVAYRGGREALERKAWPTAIEQLGRVYAANPGYARGNILATLVNANLGNGDELMGQSKPCDALATFERANGLKQDDPSIASRIATARAACTPPTQPPVATPPPIATAVPVATAPPPLPTLPPPQPSVDVEQFARSYYRAIDERRYGDAYGYLSRGAQQRQSFDQFQRQFSQTLVNIGVRFVDRVDVGSNRATFAAHTTTVSRTNAGQSRQCWQVDWQLVLEDGQWKRDSLAQREEGC